MFNVGDKVIYTGAVSPAHPEYIGWEGIILEPVSALNSYRILFPNGNRYILSEVNLRLATDKPTSSKPKSGFAAWHSKMVNNNGL